MMDTPNLTIGDLEADHMKKLPPERFEKQDRLPILEDLSSRFPRA